MRQKRFGIIGSGAVAEIHAQAIQASDKAGLAGVFSRNAAQAEAFAKKYKCQSYKTLEEMGTDDHIEFVSVCTPSGAHMEPAVYMAEKKKHLIIEKPMEITLARCDKIIDAAKKNRVVLSGIFQTRFHPSALKLKKAVENGRFGTISLASAYVKWFRSQEYYDLSSWRGTWRMDGGGTVMNQAIHAVDLLGWLMGPVDSVKAFSNTLSHKNIEVEDVFTGILQFKSGTLGVLEATTGAWPGEFKKIEICGSKGHAVLEEDKLTRWEFTDYKDQAIIEEEGIDRDGGGVQNPMDIGYKAHMYQIEDCIDALDREREPKITGKEARKAVELVLKLYESAAGGK